MKSNEKDTARRIMAQVGKDVPGLSILPIRLKGEKKIFSDACHCLGHIITDPATL